MFVITTLIPNLAQEVAENKAEPSSAVSACSCKMPWRLRSACGSAALCLFVVSSAAVSAGAAGLGEKTISNAGDQHSIRQLDGRNDTRAGAVSTPYPTLEHLAVEWEIEGDDNLDGTVNVRFRAAGEPSWRTGMPLRRVPRQIWYDEQAGHDIPDFTWANKHSGTLFGLVPGMEYEIELSLSDPDGGEARRTMRARTRPVPRAATDARIIEVTPGTLPARAATAEPGDILLLAPGQYGHFTMPASGAPGRPIVLRSRSAIAEHGDAIYVEDGRRTSSPRPNLPSREGEVVFEGLSLRDRKHVYLEGLVSFGTITLFNAEDCVVRRCRVFGLWGITAAAYGGLARWSPGSVRGFNPLPDYKNVHGVAPARATNCYIADNVITGVTPWAREVVGSKGKNIGEGIEMTGPGNVICYNRVIGFRDNISTMEGALAVDQRCMDVYNNDLEFGADDGIEFDYFMSNCRALRNRISNSNRGISAGPGFGGPLYITHNVFYNVLIHPYDPNRAAAGVVILHNTSVKSGSPGLWEFGSSYLHFENNLAIGGGTSDRPLVLPANKRLARHDYNGFGMVGRPLVASIGGKRLEGIVAVREFGGEPHAVEVGLEVFARPPEFPEPAFPARPVPDLQLAAGSPAVDAARPIPNLNDGYTGRAPDLGALELGLPPPVYGPRPFGRD
jgi:hypothetical protein